MVVRRHKPSLRVPESLFRDNDKYWRVVFAWPAPRRELDEKPNRDFGKLPEIWLLKSSTLTRLDACDSSGRVPLMRFCKHRLLSVAQLQPHRLQVQVRDACGFEAAKVAMNLVVAQI